MRLLRSLVLGIIALLLIVLGALFALHNQTQVPLNLMWATLPSASLALWLLLSLSIGVLIGALTVGGYCLRLHSRLARARRQLNEQMAQRTAPRTATSLQGMP